MKDVHKKLDSEVLRQHKGVSFVGISTTFLCHDGKGNVVMVKRSKNCRDEQGTWETGGGGLKWGQTAEENVRREIKEELCADVHNLEFLGYDDVFRKLKDSTPTHWLALRFAALVDSKQVKNGEPDMADEIGWFQLDCLPSPLHSQMKPFLRKYKKQLAEILVA